MFTAANLSVYHRQEQFWWIGGEIDMVPAKRNEFAHSEARVGEQRDHRLIAPLEITRKGVGQTDIANLLDLFGVN